MINNQYFTIIVNILKQRKEDLIDYKFFCFNGEPIYCQVISDRFSDEKIDFYGMKWNRVLGMLGLSNNAHSSCWNIPQPVSFEIMKDFAKILSSGIPFSRIDFYEVNGHPYFDEITFYPACGFGKFRRHEWGKILGDKIDLSKLNESQFD